MYKIQKTFKNNAPTIYVVATPIGNMDDFNIRAVETLKKVNTIYCEDTRTSSILLNKYGIKNKTKSLHKFNELDKVEEFKKTIINNESIAIISDAGVPGINDPGMILLNRLYQEETLNFNVTGVGCGPAYVHALVTSCFYFEKHVYLGFIDRKEIKIIKEIEQVKNSFKSGDAVAICFYESVHRIKKTLNLLSENYHSLIGEIGIFRELTKINEEVIRMKLEDLPTFIDSYDITEKGEFCVIIKFSSNVQKDSISEEEVIAKANNLIATGIRKKEAIKKLKEEFEFNAEELYKKL